MKGITDLLYDLYRWFAIAWLDFKLATIDPAAPFKGELMFKRARLARRQRRLEYRLPA